MKRMAYLPPELDADLAALASDLKLSMNQVVQVGVELLVDAWRLGRLEKAADLLFGAEVNTK